MRCEHLMPVVPELMASDGPTKPLTPCHHVNAAVERLRDEMHAVLRDDVVAIYLGDPLAGADFDPGSSDIDFLVVTVGELRDTTVRALEEMHARIAGSGLAWARKLEGSYIPKDALWCYDPENALHQTIGVDWDFGVGHHGVDGISQRHIVRAGGVVVCRPPPTTLIDEVSTEELRGAVRYLLHAFRSSQLDGPEWLRPCEYQAFAILTMCRALYAMAHGRIVSKPVTAAWGKETLEPPWAGLIERALVWRHDKQPGDMSEMLAFIRYTLAHAPKQE